ncbi:MAG: proteasome assembly chaperone family protein [Euryarchaeota archaeon]|nr:proteasome assembly chaperone family protein [Euryarchaeota archaeon]
MVVSIHELKKIDLRDGVILNGFPSVGLVSSIVGNYVIESLGLEQIGIVDSDYFPSVALVREWEPLSPVRIYGGDLKDDVKIAVFISEFQLPVQLIRPLASLILDWSDDKRASMIITPEGLVAEKSDEVNIYGIGSTEYAKKRIPDYVLKFQEGVITGVSGVLLTEGKMRDRDVIALLAEAHPDYPDARAAGKIVEVLNDMLRGVKIDPQPLYEEAKKIEENIASIREKAAQVKQIPKNYMYA